jgi:predicted Zn-dependent protease
MIGRIGRPARSIGRTRHVINRAANPTKTLLRRLFGTALAASLALAPVTEAAAQNRPRVIRDAEIESTLRAYADPIFAAAGLDTSAVQVHLIQDKRINAFVSGGMQIFIHTGLLTQAETPNEVIGVLAHETGHIMGGHLARIDEAIENATIEAIIGLIAGVAIGVASGNGGAGAGAATLGQSIAQRNLFQYTQAQEGAADQAGYTLLERTEQSPRGLVQFFKLLARQEALSSSSQDPYLRTHPLTRNRIDASEAALARSPFAEKADSPEMLMRHQRMLAKLNGYLEPFGQVMNLYPQKDISVPARYARAIALYRSSRLEEAVKEMDGLLAEAPKDAFFLEQKAQILYENGRVADSIPLYQEALDIAPTEPLIRLELATAQIQLGDPGLLDQAAAHLTEVTRLEPKNSRAFDLLGQAYYNQGNEPMADLARAEAMLARGDGKDAKRLAERALAALPEGSPGWLRAQDIQFVADQEDDEE